MELPKTVEFWRNLGYVESDRNGNRLTMLQMLPITRDPARPPRTPAPSASGWPTLLRHGDLVILTGDLGAGKTTLTQGIGAGLGVRGDVTSPTFVISRVHPSLDDGPPLVHVDAYRLGGTAELDDLDLDTDIERRRDRRGVGRGPGRGALHRPARARPCTRSRRRRPHPRRSPRSAPAGASC